MHFLKLHLSCLTSGVTRLIGPCAGYPREPPHASAQLHVLVGGVEAPQAVLRVGRHPLQGLPAEDDAGTAHAEILVGLQGQKTELLAVAAPSLANKPGFLAVYRPEELLQPVGPDVDVVVGPQEPKRPNSLFFFEGR